MSDHYFSTEPTSASRPRSFDLTVGGVSVRFNSDAGVFSADKVDKGSRVLLEALFRFCDWADKRVLDLGCGYGAIGVTLAKAGASVVMCDVNERALALCRGNAALNGVEAECVASDAGEGLEGDFDAVVTNPPIRAGKKTVCAFFANAHKLLKTEGALFVVIRRQQGADSAARYIAELFGSCETIEKESGYRVLYSVKR